MKRLAALLLASAAALSGCGSDDNGAQSTTPTGAPGAVVADLCNVLDAAAQGDTAAAKSAFDHGPLHSLAEAATATDRAVAARLLEAKEAVESDFATADTDSATLVSDLEALVAATADAIVTTGALPTPPTCDTERP